VTCISFSASANVSRTLPVRSPLPSRTSAGLPESQVSSASAPPRRGPLLQAVAAHKHAKRSAD
jgi:hypothetical protein